MAADLLLFDTSPIVNFCKSGLGIRLDEAIAGRGAFTATVLRELERKVAQFSSIGPFLERWPAKCVLSLSPRQRLDVVDLLGAFQLPGDHPRANEGEIATYVKALQLRDEGRPHIVVIDDGDGKRLVRRARGLTWAGTVDLIFEMVQAQILTVEEGGRVWRATFSDRRKWADYRSKLEAWSGEATSA